MYKVVYPFWDMKDKNKHEYKVGDTFPFDGRKIKQERLEELSSTNNKIGKILIKFEKEILNSDSGINNLDELNPTENEESDSENSNPEDVEKNINLNNEDNDNITVPSSTENSESNSETPDKNVSKKE